uniref:Glucoamylase n=1 Tax=Thermochaetoides thermophila TaxID=209285 RepID=Q0H9W2_9PEZI|nr:glucoamylase [Thermochaetoides thermophila]
MSASVLLVFAQHEVSGAASHAPQWANLQRSAVDSYIERETPIAWNALLNNIGPCGDCVTGAACGIVVARPCKSDPDYFYQWQRDAALQGQIPSIRLHRGQQEFSHEIQQHSQAQAILQLIWNPSGDNGEAWGLGEPRFMVDGFIHSWFQGWGSPQRDGPALSAIAFIQTHSWLKDMGQAPHAKLIIWPIVKNDLTYHGQYWNNSGQDLWEEVLQTTFFQIAEQHSALLEGANFAFLSGPQCISCDQAPQVLCFQGRFWKGHQCYNSGRPRSGLDFNCELGSIQMFDPKAECDQIQFQPHRDSALANHKVVQDSFRYHGCNNGHQWGDAVAVGSYPEFVYYNGMPWYLAIQAAAEQLYDAVYQWQDVEWIHMGIQSLVFFHADVLTSAAGQYTRSHTTYQNIHDAVKTYADGFVSVVSCAKYHPRNGTLHEGEHRNDGKPDSASHLHWRYAALLCAIHSRATQVPASWGEACATSPGVCTAIEQSGHYSTAHNQSWPSACSQQHHRQTPCHCQHPVAYHFNGIQQYGEIYVLGTIPALGNWRDWGCHLRADKYTNSDQIWYSIVQLPAGERAVYKYIRKWEGRVDPNRLTQVQDCGQDHW